MKGGTPEVHRCAQSPDVSLVWAGVAGEQADGADLLASPRMDALIEQWRTQYDFVLLDSAPVLAVPDVAGLARFCDRALLVVRYKSTTMQAAGRSYRMIEKHLPDCAALEVVMNGVPEKSPDYFAYYGCKGVGCGQA